MDQLVSLKLEKEEKDKLTKSKLLSVHTQRRTLDGVGNRFPQ